jgi:hypothetical protein
MRDAIALHRYSFEFISMVKVSDVCVSMLCVWPLEPKLEEGLIWLPITQLRLPIDHWQIRFRVLFNYEIVSALLSSISRVQAFQSVTYHEACVILLRSNANIA